MSSEDGLATSGASAPPRPQLASSEVLQTLTACLPHLRRYIAAQVPPGCRLDAEDLAQDAFLRAFARLRHLRFHSRGEVLAYLKRTATNLLLDEHRRVVRRPGFATLDERIAVRQSSALDRVLARERRRQVGRKLLAMRPEMRQAIVLRLRGECDTTQLAIVLGRSTTGAARVAFSRAVAALTR